MATMAAIDDTGLPVHSITSSARFSGPAAAAVPTVAVGITMPVIVPARSNFMNGVITSSSFHCNEAFTVSKLAQSLFCEPGA